MKKGTDNSEEKLILGWHKEDAAAFKCKLDEVISWHNLDALRGNKKPLIIDNGVMWKILDEAVQEIESLETELEVSRNKLKTIKNLI